MDGSDIDRGSTRLTVWPLVSGYRKTVVWWLFWLVRRIISAAGFSRRRRCGRAISGYDQYMDLPLLPIDRCPNDGQVLVTWRTHGERWGDDDGMFHAYVMRCPQCGCMYGTRGRNRLVPISRLTHLAS